MQSNAKKLGATQKKSISGIEIKNIRHQFSTLNIQAVFVL
jgi:hypothetical protein